jgi:tetratricopeptide (TPR) repeat protein
LHLAQLVFASCAKLIYYTVMRFGAGYLSAFAAAGLLLSGCAAPRALSSRGEPVLWTTESRADLVRAQAHAHYATAVIHDLNEEAELAMREFYLAASKDPGNETLVLEISRRLLQARQPEKALELLSAAAKLPNASSAIFARLGLVYAQLGKQEQAVAANRAAIKLRPGSLTGYQNLFVGHLQSNQHGEALKVLDEAARAPGVGADFLIALAELYANFALQAPGQREAAHKKALSVLERAESLDVANPVLTLKLADGFNVLGNSEKAAALYHELLERLPNLPILRESVRAKLTDIYLRHEDRTRAVEQLEEIIRNDPTNPQAYYFLGSIAYEEKEFERAAENFSKTVLLNPEFEQAHYDLAGALITLDKPGESIATLDEARRRFSSSFVLEYLAGMAHSRAKNYAEAIASFTAAEIIGNATEPKRLNHIFYFQFGAAYERNGDHAQAEKYFEKCIEMAPDFAEALNYLGYMWAEQGTNLIRARELIEKALEVEPDSAAYLDSMGWVLYKLEQPREALEYILKAVELSEEPDATLYDHLGDIYETLHRTDEAQEAWRKSISIEPNDEVQRKLEPVSLDDDAAGPR